ncbi:2-phospho-L-lactate guanylyltransferase [Micromonospora olivasterospora]|uniref:2-phospho-L-lactate guanylyltransferase n=1 Tax=Micromonospora olivasterospora TaxID=1880 RepID=A0A562I5N0_MICOL|nr:2-phospho-L-lactate guanylyltransferase [Micromonospora olivasterospora]TWH65933.1 2-phospho-L-lactate guanylyltransferase [Micromonospora olivasterospora]
MTNGSWVVVVPAKPFAAAKTRCADLDVSERSALARAMLLDVVGGLTRARRVRAVVVAATDPEVAGAALSCGAVVAGTTRGPDLNREVLDALTVAREALPDARLAVAMADLAGAQPADFDAALAAAGSHSRAIVSDADGTGTTMVTLTVPGEFRPFLGPGSRCRFLADGYHDLPVAAPGLRRDVDTVSHLLALGTDRLGGATRSWCGSPASTASRPRRSAEY